MNLQVYRIRSLRCITTCKVIHKSNLLFIVCFILSFMHLKISAGQIFYCSCIHLQKFKKRTLVPSGAVLYMYVHVVGASWWFMWDALKVMFSLSPSYIFFLLISSPHCVDLFGGTNFGNRFL